MMFNCNSLRFGYIFVPEKEQMAKVVENEKLRRNGILEPSQRCLELQGSHLGKPGNSKFML